MLARWSGASPLQKAWNVVDLILLVIDYAVLGHWQPYLERVVRMLFCLHAIRFITIFKPMRHMVSCMLLTVRPVTSVVLMSELLPRHSTSPSMRKPLGSCRLYISRFHADWAPQCLLQLPATAIIAKRSPLPS